MTAARKGCSGPPRAAPVTPVSSTAPMRSPRYSSGRTSRSPVPAPGFRVLVLAGGGQSTQRGVGAVVVDADRQGAAIGGDEATREGGGDRAGVQAAVEFVGDVGQQLQAGGGGAPPAGGGHLRPHPRQELGGGERLDQVVVGAAVQAVDDRLGAGPCRHHHDRDVPGPLVRAQRAQQPEAVQAGHHHVGQYELGRILQRELQGLLAVGHGVDPPVRGQEPDQVGAHVGVVVHHQHLHRSRRCARGADPAGHLAHIRRRPVRTRTPRRCPSPAGPGRAPG